MTTTKAPPSEGRVVRSSRSFLVGGASVPAPPLTGGLYVVATPIGNLADVTLRALSILAGADGILAEDTRVSRTLLARYGIETPVSPYHEHNAAEVRPRALRRIAEGEALALISDAGTPLISDPGYKLVAEAVALGLPVSAAPGPSAALAALCVAGLPTDRFFFEGFLPVKQSARRARINALAAVPGTLIFYEAPGRLADALADLMLELGPRPAAVARELTKLHEEVRRGSLGALAAEYAGAEARRQGARSSSSSAPLRRGRRFRKTRLIAKSPRRSRNCRSGTPRRRSPPSTACREGRSTRARLLSRARRGEPTAPRRAKEEPTRRPSFWPYGRINRRAASAPQGLHDSRAAVCGIRRRNRSHRAKGRFDRLCRGQSAR